MHKIHAKEFTLEDFSTEHLRPNSIKRLVDAVEALNYYRDIYLNGGMDDNLEGDAVTVFEPKDKYIWWQMIQLLPSSYNQTRNIMMNYEVLANIYKSRKDHKLDEWRELCKWIKKLPYSELITGNDTHEETKMIYGVPVKEKDMANSSSYSGAVFNGEC